MTKILGEIRIIIASSVYKIWTDIGIPWRYCVFNSRPHHNIENITIKQVTWFFGFSVHMNAMFTYTIGLKISMYLP